MYLHDLSQTFTDIRVLKVMNMCQILSMYLNANKNYGKKTEFQWNLELVVVNICGIQYLVNVHEYVTNVLLPNVLLPTLLFRIEHLLRYPCSATPIQSNVHLPYSAIKWPMGHELGLGKSGGWAFM